MAAHEPTDFGVLETQSHVANDVDDEGPKTERYSHPTSTREGNIKAPASERLAIIIESIRDLLVTTEDCVRAAEEFNKKLAEKPHPTILGVTFDQGRKLFTFSRIPSSKFPDTHFEISPTRFFTLGAIRSSEIIDEIRFRLKRDKK